MAYYQMRSAVFSDNGTLLLLHDIGEKLFLSVGFGLHFVGFQLQIVGFGLHAVGFQLQIVKFMPKYEEVSRFPELSLSGPFFIALNPQGVRASQRNG